MISEIDFANRYTSFWHQCLPWGENTVREINRNVREFTNPRPDRGERQDLVGELGFRLFAARISEGRISSNASVEDLEEIVRQSADYIARLRREPDVSLPSPAELAEAQKDADALARFVREYEPQATLIPFPQFYGCGILDACKGDFVAGKTLYEVKATGKGFLQPHLRQLVVYCALNFASPVLDIRRIGLINPRHGTFFRSDLATFVTKRLGKTPETLYSEIIDFLSTSMASI